MVDEAISKEKLEVEIPNLTEAVKLHLENLGYEVTTKKKEDGTNQTNIYVVSWANPPLK
jgi:hypothetical protein